MTNYYMLECFMPEGWSDYATLEPVDIDGIVSWSIGRYYNVQLPEPIQVEISPGDPDNLKEMYYNDAIVMTKRLYQSLQEIGVDNMQTFSCVISNPETGFQTEDYLVVNLVGLIAAADIDNSEVVGGSSDHLYDTDFDSVAIDDSKARGVLVFRLAENTSAIMVHQKVKDHLLKKGVDMLTFVEPKNWMG